MRPSVCPPPETANASTLIIESMTYSRDQIQAVYEIIDLLESDDIVADADALHEVQKVLEDCAIERFERPSRRPTVPGHPGSSPKQLEIQHTFESGEDRIIAVGGGNRSSKTTTIGGMCVCKWIRDRAPDGAVVWVVAQDVKMMRLVPHRILWDFLPQWMFPKDRPFSDSLGLGLNPIITLTTKRGKCSVVFMTEEMGLDKFESQAVDLVWWTEAEREAIFDAVQSRLVDRRGRLVIDYLPTQGWHKHRLRLNPQVRHFKLSMWDNAHNLPPGEIERLKATLTDQASKIRIEGEEASSFGVVYPEFKPEVHTVKPFPIPTDAPRYRCYDYGYRDPSVCLWVALLPSDFELPFFNKLLAGQERLIVYRELYEPGLTIPKQAERIIELSGSETYRFGGRMVVDPSIYNTTQVSGPTAETIAQQFERAGLRCRPGKRTNVIGEHAMVALVRDRFMFDQMLFFDTCEMAIRDHESWRYKDGKDGEVPDGEPFEHKHSHACDALKYLCAEKLTYHQPVIEASYADV